MTSQAPDADALLPEMNLALGYASSSLRAGFDALLRFDYRLGAGVAAAKEPRLARIRLAWWRDEIQSAESEARPANDPLLAVLLGVVRRRDVTSGQLVRIIEGWAELLEPLPLTPQILTDYANGRGGGLFAAASATSGTSTPDRAGDAFALVDFARNCSDPLSRERALALASELPTDVLPRAIRPFALLDDWARRDAHRILRGLAPLSLRRRAVSALTFAVTGPR